jgi:glycosyltransferase involved in cell wall biosynthesis
VIHGEFMRGNPGGGSVKQITMFLSCQGCGLTGLLTEQAVAFARSQHLDFAFVSDQREQQKGLFRHLHREGLRVDTVRNLDDHSEFRAKARRLAGLFEQTGAEAVHVQTNWQLALTAMARHWTKREFKILYTVHGFRNNSRVKSPVARVAMGVALWLAADLVIAPSSFVQGRFARFSRKSALLHLGVDAPLMSHPRVSPRNRPRTIVFAGQFRPGKNQAWLIRAAAEYVRRTGDQTVRIALPGDGSTRTECRRLARTLGLEANVDMPGTCTRAGVLHYYRKASCAVIASDSETFGHCIAEPYVLGIPILSRPVGIARDVIRQGETGWLFHTPAELVDLLVHVLPDERRLDAVSQNAFRARALFSWEQIRQSYEHLMEGLSNGPGRSPEPTAPPRVESGTV